MSALPCVALSCHAKYCIALSCHVVAWHGMALIAIAWHGIAWHGVVWRGVACNVMDVCNVRNVSIVCPDARLPATGMYALLTACVPACQHGCVVLNCVCEFSVI